MCSTVSIECFVNVVERESIEFKFQIKIKPKGTVLQTKDNTEIQIGDSIRKKTERITTN